MVNEPSASRTLNRDLPRSGRCRDASPARSGVQAFKGLRYVERLNFRRGAGVTRSMLRWRDFAGYLRWVRRPSG